MAGKVSGGSKTGKTATAKGVTQTARPTTNGKSGPAVMSTRSGIGSTVPTTAPIRTTIPVVVAPVEQEDGQDFDPITGDGAALEDANAEFAEAEDYEAEAWALSTDELPDPRSPKPDAVRCRIMGVEDFQSDKGATAIVVNLYSDDLNKDVKVRVFVPAQFVEDILVSPKSLPSEKGNNKASQYAMGIHNQDNKATVDQFRLVAKEQGRTAKGLGLGKPETFADFITNLNTLLGPIDGEHVNVVLLRRPNNGFLEVRNILNPTLIDTKPQIFDRYRKSWEVEQTGN